mmetsp:Transcript_48174/g.71383  ORF Transcript_48174/g.71383 Transcript_48174/m.71383 type:complete len:394 (+) Transcript_48174:190-1371(+)|eukprot:CAMPEP_0195530826 /NCGR_PEP_ID=MMETSP0794_2-20130614/33885_1 /TAXON_ID=515487 /ORGANISM="Stephanopyxis turris, Strain CCMP 815" /LENGTH=393 /DNA_ID=CAMNT_0040662411 /DNA_START=169 /DNA_END=1350 /DNA_ORIENTATION=+
MKFCKNLQRVVDISDPEWAPYWTNYKMLKKLIKELPSLVPSDEQHQIFRNHVKTSTAAHLQPHCKQPSGSQGANASSLSEKEWKEKVCESLSSQGTRVKNVALSVATRNPENELKEKSNTPSLCLQQRQTPRAKMGKSPGEVAFFKLLYAELNKAIHFFDRAQEEFTIREERIKEGMSIYEKPNSIMLVNDRWSALAKSLYRLYKDLLLLETFAIMTYCSFSKILKKHDKVTGYDTRNAFMLNVVNKANFTNYPRVLEMIQRCETFYEEVSGRLLSEGKESLCEDERLFINMIHRLNEQATNTAASEGGPDFIERKIKNRQPIVKCDGEKPIRKVSGCKKALALQSLVEDNDAKSEKIVREASSYSDEEVRKRCVATSGTKEDASKKRARNIG